MLPTFQLAHVALHCTDLASMEAFYRDLLGYTVVWRPDPDNCYLSRGRDSLALHAGVASGSESRLDHFGMTLDSPQAVDLWAKHLREAGAQLEGEPRTHRDGTRSFYVRDPEGNRIQFMHLGAGMTLP